MKPTIGLFLCFGAALIHASPGEYFSFKWAEHCNEISLQFQCRFFLIFFFQRRLNQSKWISIVFQLIDRGFD